jgi:hypothetical protein
MEFNMLTFTKQDSIVIAVTLGIVLGVPLLVPAHRPSRCPTNPATGSRICLNGTGLAAVTA